jgi:hypothetical protein
MNTESDDSSSPVNPLNIPLQFTENGNSQPLHIDESLDTEQIIKCPVFYKEPHNSSSYYESILRDSQPRNEEGDQNYVASKPNQLTEDYCQKMYVATPNVEEIINQKMAIIIDTRFDELMENVINNFMFFLKPRGWGLTIISHLKYENEIRTKFPYCIFGKIEDDLIYIDENNIPNITIQTYNKILMSPFFWNNLNGEHLLLFQKDCVMYNMFDDIFMNYDFAGANTYFPHIQTFFNGMMNGGFSLRKKSAMLECCQKISCDIINNYIRNMKKILSYTSFENTLSNSYQNIIKHNFLNTNLQIYDNYMSDNINEDIFFTFACEILQKKMPDVFIRNRLSIEFVEHMYFDIFPETTNLPAVYHGWNHNYHSIKMAKYLVSFSSYFQNCQDGNEEKINEFSGERSNIVRRKI